MVSRRWDPGIGEVVRVGADTNHDQKRGDMIRDCGGKIGIESILGKEIFGSLRICGMVGIWIPFSIIIMTKWRLYRGTFSSSCRKMEEFNWGFGNLGLGKLEIQREIGIVISWN